MVQFIQNGDDGDVSVVPVSWVKQDLMTCLWPTNCRNVRSQIIRRQMPEKGWVEYPCIIHESFGKFLSFIAGYC